MPNFLCSYKSRSISSGTTFMFHMITCSGVFGLPLTLLHEPSRSHPLCVIKSRSISSQLLRTTTFLFIMCFCQKRISYRESQNSFTFSPFSTGTLDFFPAISFTYFYFSVCIFLKDYLHLSPVSTRSHRLPPKRCRAVEGLSPVEQVSIHKRKVSQTGEINRRTSDHELIHLLTVTTSLNRLLLGCYVIPPRLGTTVD